MFYNKSDRMRNGANIYSEPFIQWNMWWKIWNLFEYNFFDKKQ